MEGETTSRCLHLRAPEQFGHGPKVQGTNQPTNGTRRQLCALDVEKKKCLQVLREAILQVKDNTQAARPLILDWP